MSDATRAKAGGERGINGEWYEGGKFLPSTQTPKRAPSRRSSQASRALVAPGVVEEVPDGLQAIFPRVCAFVCTNPDGTLQILAHLDCQDHPCWNHYGPHEQTRALVDLFNSGERFTKV